MKNECIGIFNLLLRGERSALETYEKVLNNLDDAPHRNRLEQICSGHRAKVSELEDHITSLGGHPEVTSGTWGVVASVVQKVVNAIGDHTSVHALKEKEELSLRNYQASLDHVLAEPECSHLIQNCISAQRENLAKLENILAEKTA
jgi:uncharacterized protein (TIGR02284 family)